MRVGRYTLGTLPQRGSHALQRHPPCGYLTQFLNCQLTIGQQLIEQPLFFNIFKALQELGMANKWLLCS